METPRVDPVDPVAPEASPDVAPLDAARFRRLKQEFQLLLESDPRHRAAALERLGFDEPALARRLAAWLAAEEGHAGDWLEEPAALGFEPAADATAEVALPASVGPWKVEAELGRGGMARVFLGRRADGAFDQRVAIKVVRAERASELLRRRFLGERRILAGLVHPNIAHLIDGGTTDEGVPYLVMEHVAGQPIDRYCDGRGLEVEERLRLFILVCGAVHFAHQKLVLHRDIKSANVLVDESGHPKLLDFGIAELLTPAPAEDGRGSFDGARALTPGWASPEQLRGERLTTASDVFSLGVLLHVLLTGEQPVAGEVRNGRRRLRGDLQRILDRVLAPAPERRYGTVAELTADLERFLSSRPVTAHPPSARYRFGKLVRRHRTAAVATALAGLAVIGAFVAVSWEAARARRGEQRARAAFADVRGLARSVVGELHDAIRDLPGATSARRLLVARAVEYLDRLARQAAGDESLQRELAGAYVKIGDAQGNPYAANLGDQPAALRSYRQAFAIHEALWAAHPADDGLRRDIAADHARIADMLWARGEYPGALARYRRATALYQALLTTPLPRLEDRFQMGRVLHKIGLVELRAGDAAAAARTYRQTFALMASLVAAAPRSVAYRRGLANAALKVGDAAQAEGDDGAAYASHRQGEETIAVLSHENPASADLRRLLAVAVSRLASDQLRLHHPLEAARLARQALATQEALMAADPENVQVQIDSADSDGILAEALAAQGEGGLAAATLRRGIATRQRARTRTPGYAAEEQNFARLYLALGRVLSGSDPRAAFRAYAAAASLLLREPVRSEDPSLLAEGYTGMADAQVAIARTEPPVARRAALTSARHWFAASRAVLAAPAPSRHLQARYSADLAALDAKVARLELDPEVAPSPARR